MKLQIDTELKTIKLESQTNLKEFFEKIQNFLPDWAEYKLETNVTINWGAYPVYRDPWYTHPYNPHYGAITLDSVDNGCSTLIGGPMPLNSMNYDIRNSSIFNYEA